MYLVHQFNMQLSSLWDSCRNVMTAPHSSPPVLFLAVPLGQGCFYPRVTELSSRYPQDQAFTSFRYLLKGHILRPFLTILYFKKSSVQNSFICFIILHCTYRNLTCRNHLFFWPSLGKHQMINSTEQRTLFIVVQLVFHNYLLHEWIQYLPLAYFVKSLFHFSHFILFSPHNTLRWVPSSFKKKKWNLIRLNILPTITTFQIEEPRFNLRSEVNTLSHTRYFRGII